jgi:hypothetical protein
MIVVDASTLVGAALKPDSVPEQAVLRAEDVDVFALSAPVDTEISEVLNRPNRPSELNLGFALAK